MNIDDLELEFLKSQDYINFKCNFDLEKGLFHKEFEKAFHEWIGRNVYYGRYNLD